MTMPSELICLVIDEMDDEDLPNTRSTCRCLHAHSLERFSLRFRSRRFVFSLHSMQALTDISMHPVFAPRLESLMFGTYSLQQPLISTFRADQTHGTSREHACAWQSQTGFIKSGHHVEFLRRALLNIKKHRSTIDLGIYDDPINCQNEPIAILPQNEFLLASASARYTVTLLNATLHARFKASYQRRI